MRMRAFPQSYYDQDSNTQVYGIINRVDTPKEAYFWFVLEDKGTMKEIARGTVFSWTDAIEAIQEHMDRLIST